MLCDQLGLTPPLIYANLNIVGFRMNRAPQEVKQPYGNGRSKQVAMSVLASGALCATESAYYVRRVQGADSILFGSSCKSNIESNIALIQRAA